jgi:hypothetical protein
MLAVSQSECARGMRVSREPCQIPTGVVMPATSSPQGRTKANWSSIHPSRLSAKVARGALGHEWPQFVLAFQGKTQCLPAARIEPAEEIHAVRVRGRQSCPDGASRDPVGQ